MSNVTYAYIQNPSVTDADDIVGYSLPAAHGEKTVQWFRFLNGNVPAVCVFLLESVDVPRHLLLII